jgi:hypothetical protein
MGILIVIAVLAVGAVLGLAWRLPPAMRQPTVRQVLVVLIYGYQPPPPRHRAPGDNGSWLQVWQEDEPPYFPPPQSMDLASERAARYCAGLPDRPQLTDRELWEQDRPGLLALPARTADISGGGEAITGRPAPCPRTDGSMIRPGAWRASLAAALAPTTIMGRAEASGPPGAALGPLPPHGDQLPPDDPPDYLGDPPEDSGGQGWTLGAMHWEPSRLANRDDQVRAWMAAQDADALLTIERIRGECARALAGLRLQLAVASW